MIRLENNSFSPIGYWTKQLEVYEPCASSVALFDQNGFDLTEIEIHYADVNAALPEYHRKHRVALKTPWFTQEDIFEGPVLNHSLLFERKAYAGAALEQLKEWAKTHPLLYKIIAMRPKWGLDFSMDYVDHDGNAFEILHWEWDSFDYDEIEKVKKTIEPILLRIDWQEAAKEMLQQKNKWHHLDFFAQSDWKCNFFGIPKERFKMVVWN
jgi:hypothetical protein